MNLKIQNHKAKNLAKYLRNIHKIKFFKLTNFRILRTKKTCIRIEKCNEIAIVKVFINFRR